MGQSLKFCLKTAIKKLNCKDGVKKLGRES